MKRLLSSQPWGDGWTGCTGGLSSQATQIRAARPRSGSLAAARVVAYAKSFVGYPYATVGSSPNTGLTASALCGAYLNKGHDHAGQP